MQLFAAQMPHLVYSDAWADDDATQLHKEIGAKCVGPSSASMMLGMRRKEFSRICRKILMVHSWITMQLGMRQQPAGKELLQPPQLGQPREVRCQGDLKLPGTG